jgi:hypothetical protein
MLVALQKMQEEAENAAATAESSDEDNPEAEGIMTQLQSTVEAVHVRGVPAACLHASSFSEFLLEVTQGVP